MAIVNSRLKSVMQAALNGDRTIHASSLLAGFVGLYGLEALSWDPSTIDMELSDDFDGKIKNEVFDKLMAAVTAITTDTVYRDVGVFDSTISAFSGGGLSDEDDIPTVEELCLTVAELFVIDPAPEQVKFDAGRWHHDVRKYCRVVLDDEGFAISPAVLSWVPNRPPKVAAHSEPNPAELAATIAEQEARAKEVDVWVDGHVEQIVQEVRDMGLNVDAWQAGD